MVAAAEETRETERNTIMSRNTGIVIVVIMLLSGLPCLGADTVPKETASAQKLPAVPLDPAAAAAVREIEAKLQALRSYSCMITMLGHAESVKGPQDSETKVEEAYKRPCKFKIHATMVKAPHVGEEGAVQDTVVDGRTWLSRGQNAPGSGQRMLDAGYKPSMSAEEFIREHEKPVVTTKNLEALLASGFTEDELAEQVYSKILSPFARCDMATLKIQSEDDTQWTFLARLKNDPLGREACDFRLVTIGKADGILKEIHSGRDDGRWQGTTRVDRIELNPDLPDAFFQIPSTPGAEKQ